jgi:hypothetical protein
LALIGTGTHQRARRKQPFSAVCKIMFTPYLWLANINSTILTPIDREPQLDSDVGPFQLLGHLNATPGPPRCSIAFSIYLASSPIWVSASALGAFRRT